MFNFSDVFVYVEKRTPWKYSGSMPSRVPESTVTADLFEIVTPDKSDAILNVISIARP